MRAREFLPERKAKPAPVVDQEPELDPSIQPGDPASDPLYSLKLAVASKIKVMPPDRKAEKALRDIEDLLQHVGAGGRKIYLDNQLKEIDDVDVNRARALLAKYINSLDMTPDQRTDLFNRWKNDELIDKELLLSPGKHLITDVVIGYDDASNPAIKELTDDLAKVAALGQGKGEFLLSVFSKQISKLHKGDLLIGESQIEVKTQDVGAGRFYDQEVRPAQGYQQAVEDFKENWKDYIKRVFKSLKESGLKLIDIIDLRNTLPPELKDDYDTDVTNVLNNIFPGMDVEGIMEAIRSGSIGIAKQRYAVTNLDFYISRKTEDDGILFIDLAKDPVSLVFFTSNDELNQGNMRLHAKTVYPITNDPRNAYPQIQILPTKHASGGDIETSSATNAEPAEPVAPEPVAGKVKKPAAPQPPVANAAPVVPPKPVANKPTTPAKPIAPIQAKGTIKNSPEV